MADIRNVVETDVSLAEYRSNALLVFFLGLYCNSDDRDQLAADAIVDQSNDKKLDVVHIDTENRRAIVCQSYFREDWNKSAAPANKAASLSIGLGWLLTGDLSTLPPNLREKALDLRSAIDDQEIERIDLLYVHNCPESANVEHELATVAASALRLVDQSLVSINAFEYGLNKITRLYESQEKQILVEDDVEVPGAFIEQSKTDEWTALSGTVTGDWLYDLLDKYGDSLFSANVREYLGSRTDKRNINHGIKQTTASEPENFYIYNNGITLICNSFNLRGGSYFLSGISIVNGAQTTGAIHEAGREDASRCSVPCRIIWSSKPQLIEKVIKFNNTQNSVRASDRKSNDRVQKKLSQEFAEQRIPYVHRRRSGQSPREAVSVESLGQSLAAFHGLYTLSTRNRSNIFEVESQYRRVFPEALEVRHAYLVHCLSLAIDRYRINLKAKFDAGEATQSERMQHELMRLASSKQLVLYLCGRFAESLMGRPVPDLFRWGLHQDYITPYGSDVITCWQKVIERIMPIVVRSLEASAYDTTRSEKLLETLSEKITGILDSLADDYAGAFEELRRLSSP